MHTGHGADTSWVLILAITSTIHISSFLCENSTIFAGPMGIGQKGTLELPLEQAKFPLEATFFFVDKTKTKLFDKQWI